MHTHTHKTLKNAEKAQLLYLDKCSTSVRSPALVFKCKLSLA